MFSVQTLIHKMLTSLQAQQVLTKILGEAEGQVTAGEGALLLRR